MKPIVHFDLKECDDKKCVIVEKDRLKEILNEVYQAGYEDGIKNKEYGYPITTTPWYSTTKVDNAKSSSR